MAGVTVKDRRNEREEEGTGLVIEQQSEIAFLSLTNIALQNFKQPLPVVCTVPTSCFNMM